MSVGPPGMSMSLNVMYSLSACIDHLCDHYDDQWSFIVMGVEMETTRNIINLVGDPVPSVPCVLKVDEEVEEENIKLVMLRYETLVGEP